MVLSVIICIQLFVAYFFVSLTGANMKKFITAGIICSALVWFLAVNNASVAQFVADDGILYRGLRAGFGETTFKMLIAFVIGLAFGGGWRKALLPACLAFALAENVNYSFFSGSSWASTLVVRDLFTPWIHCIPVIVVLYFNRMNFLSVILLAGSFHAAYDISAMNSLSPIVLVMAVVSCSAMMSLTQKELFEEIEEKV